LLNAHEGFFTTEERGDRPVDTDRERCRSAHSAASFSGGCFRAELPDAPGPAFIGLTSRSVFPDSPDKSSLMGKTWKETQPTEAFFI
jgi:hypothetical protein